MSTRILFFVVVAGLMPASATAQRAEHLYGEACDGGDMLACNVFGLMYESGTDVPRDLVRAVDLYKRACEGGALAGCTNLGLMYQAGMGVSPDTARAQGLYRTACEGGERLGCDLLATLEGAGDGPGRAESFHKSGRVGDAENARTIREAIVEIPSLGVQAVSDPVGRVDLGPLPRGTYHMRAEALGYLPLEADLEVPGKGEFVVLLNRDAIRDTAVAGRIDGRVREDSGGALPDVEVAVLGQGDVRTLSNQQGRFTLSGVQPGLVEVRFVLLGHAPRTAMLIVQPGSTSEIDAAMSVEPIELDPIAVTVRPRALEQNGFYRRAARGFGSQFDRQDLEDLNINWMSDVLYRAPGVRIQYGPHGEVIPVSRRASSPGLNFTGGCVLTLYVDGVKMFDSDMDWIDPEDVEAIEVYTGVGTPVEYGGLNSCGVILVWTRR